MAKRLILGYREGSPMHSAGVSFFSDDAVIASISGYDFDSFGNTVSVSATQPVIIGFDALCTARCVADSKKIK